MRIVTSSILFITFTAALIAVRVDAAPLPGQEPELEAAAPDGWSREKKRLLHLRTGEVVRARTRFADGQWEYRVRKEWRPLEAARVVRVVSEREALSEAKKRRRQAYKGTLDSRAGFAQWARDEGLLQESMQELENILSQEPDHEWALRLLSGGPGLASLPRANEEDAAASRQELLRYGAQGGAVARELAARELARFEDQEAVLADLEADLRATSIRRRAFAAHALGRVQPGKETRHLLMRTVLDSSADVRKSCAYALKATGEPGMALPMLRALASRNTEVRTNAAEALGHLGHAAAVEPLIGHFATLAAAQGSGSAVVPRANIFVGRQFAYVQDFDVEVAQFQAVADPQVNVVIEGSVLEGRVIGVRQSAHIYERSTVRGALRKLTGADPGDRPQDWLDWWEENKHRFQDGGKRTASTR